MCVIAAKPAGVKMPTAEQMKVMWYNNPDGAGIMYAKDGKVHIDKGYMKLADFLSRVEALGKTVDLDQIPVVLHFRIASAGGVCPEHCHPFPLTSSEYLIRRLCCDCEVGIAHNGTIHGYGNSFLSDTMQYIMLQMLPLSKAVPRFYENQYALEMIVNSTKGSWMVLLTGEGKLITIGDFFIERGGIYYSNKTMYHRPCFCDIYENGGQIRADQMRERQGEGQYVNKKPLMWIDENWKADIVDNEGKTVKQQAGQWLTDEENRVYRWVMELDGAVEVPQYRAVPERGYYFSLDKAVFTEIYV